MNAALCIPAICSHQLGFCAFPCRPSPLLWKPRSVALSPATHPPLYRFLNWMPGPPWTAPAPCRPPAANAFHEETSLCPLRVENSVPREKRAPSHVLSRYPMGWVSDTRHGPKRASGSPWASALPDTLEPAKPMHRKHSTTPSLGPPFGSTRDTTASIPASVAACLVSEEAIAPQHVPPHRPFVPGHGHLSHWTTRAFSWLDGRHAAGVTDWDRLLSGCNLSSGPIGWIGDNHASRTCRPAVPARFSAPGGRTPPTGSCAASACQPCPTHHRGLVVMLGLDIEALTAYARLSLLLWPTHAQRHTRYTLWHTPAGQRMGRGRVGRTRS